MCSTSLEQFLKQEHDFKRSSSLGCQKMIFITHLWKMGQLVKKKKKIFLAAQFIHVASYTWTRTFGNSWESERVYKDWFRYCFALTESIRVKSGEGLSQDCDFCLPSISQTRVHCPRWVWFFGGEGTFSWWGQEREQERNKQILLPSSFQGLLPSSFQIESEAHNSLWRDPGQETGD